MITVPLVDLILEPDRIIDSAKAVAMTCDNVFPYCTSPQAVNKSAVSFLHPTSLVAKIHACRQLNWIIPNAVSCSSCRDP